MISGGKAADVQGQPQIKLFSFDKIKDAITLHHDVDSLFVKSQCFFPPLASMSPLIQVCLFD